MEQHDKEPVNGRFEDCSKEMLPAAEEENNSDEEDQDVASE